MKKAYTVKKNNQKASSWFKANVDQHFEIHFFNNYSEPINVS